MATTAEKVGFTRVTRVTNIVAESSALYAVQRNPIGSWRSLLKGVKTCIDEIVVRLKTTTLTLKTALAEYSVLIPTYQTDFVLQSTANVVFRDAIWKQTTLAFDLLYTTRG